MRPVYDDHRRRGRPIARRHAFQQFIAGAVGQREIHHDAIEHGALHFLDGFRDGARLDDRHRLAHEQRVDALTQRRIVFHHEHAAHALRRARFELADRDGQFVARARLERIADRAEMQRDIGMISRGNDVNRNMARERIVLEPFEHGQARLVRQTDIEQDAVRLHLARAFDALRRAGRVHAVEIEFVREVVENVREIQIVFDDENRAIRTLAVAAIVSDGLHVVDGRGHRRRGGRCHGGRRQHGGRFRLLHVADGIELRGDCAFARADRQRHRKHAAPARFARHNDRAAQQTRELARDRQAETAAAVLAARGAVGLLERLEDHVLLVARDAPMPVSRTSKRSASSPARVTTTVTLPRSVNLNAFDSRLRRICMSR